MKSDEQMQGRVMVVDDTPINLSLMEEMLTTAGYVVAAFPDGARALRAANVEPPDLILLDVMMPEMDGFQVCKQLKQEPRLSDIPVLFISALDDVSSKVKAFAAGGVDYVTKPFQPEEVLARVRTQLILRRQQERIEAQHREIQESYTALQKLETQRDQLVHMMVHDMRSPLTAMLLHAEYLHTTLADQEENHESIEAIITSSRRLRDMITILLDISRMESHEMPLSLEECDLRELVDASQESLSGVLGKVTFVYAPPAESCRVVCDRQITQRVIENLLANAIQFTPQQSRVALFLAPTASGMQLAVEDSGPGIPPEYHEKIFEKFGQVNARKEGRAYSSGLGLTFCKLGIEAQGGTIGLESQVGQGSRFWFTLPATSGSAHE
jgi:two-component system, sensor histidine kinase and response regulator